MIPPHGMLPITVPGCVDGWFELHEKFGKLPMKRGARAGDPLRRARASRSLSSSLTTGRAASRCSRNSPARFRTPIRSNGRAPAKGEMFKNPALAEDAARCSRRAVATRSTRARSRTRWTPSSPPTAATCAKVDFEKHTSHLGRPGLDELPRLRRLGTAAEWPGHRRAADPEHPRRVRPEVARLQFAAGSAPHGRGEEAGVRGSGEVLRRPGVRKGARSRS